MNFTFRGEKDQMKMLIVDIASKMYISFSTQLMSIQASIHIESRHGQARKA